MAENSHNHSNAKVGIIKHASDYYTNDKSLSKKERCHKILDEFGFYLSSGETEDRINSGQSIYAFLKSQLSSELKTDPTQLSLDGEFSFYSFFVIKFGKLLFTNNKFKEALPIFEELFNINQSNIFRITDFLISCLIVENKLKDALKVLDTIPLHKLDTISHYNSTLLLFLSSTIEQTSLSLAVSIMQNNWVVKYLCKEKKLPKKLVKDSLDFEGLAGEAQWYLWGPGRIWHLYPEALQFMFDAYENFDEFYEHVSHLIDDPGFEEYDQNLEIAPVDPIITIDELNKFLEEIGGTDLKHRKAILPLVLKYSRMLCEREPWHLFGERPFSLSFSDNHPPIIAMFSGQGGEVLGFNVFYDEEDMGKFRGTGDELDYMDLSSEGEVIRRDLVIADTRSLALHVDELNGLERVERSELTKYKAECLGGILYPFAKESFYGPRIATTEELLVLLGGLVALMMASNSIGNIQGFLPLFNLPIKDCQLNNLLEELFDKYEERLSDVDTLIEKEIDSLNRLLSETKMSEAGKVWEIGFSGKLGFVKGDIKSKQAIKVLSNAMVVDQDSGIVLGFRAFTGDDIPFIGLIRALKDVIRKSKTKPSKILLQKSIISDEIEEFISTIQAPIELSLETDALSNVATEPRERMDEAGKVYH